MPGKKAPEQFVPPPQPEVVVPYTPAERKIFQYYNGKQWLWADPIAIHRKLGLALQPELFSDVIVQTNDKDPAIRTPAKEKILRAARIAFEMPYFPAAKTEEEYGATETHVSQAVNAFLGFDKKKEKTGGTGPTGSESSTSTLSAKDESHTTSTTGDGSTSPGNEPPWPGSGQMPSGLTPQSP